MLDAGNRTPAGIGNAGAVVAAAPSTLLTGARFSGMARRVDQHFRLKTQRRTSADVDELVLRVAQSDRLALKSLYDRTSAKLYGICRRITGDETEAQDVLQEVFVLVWRKAARFDPVKASAITWLAALARNKAVDRIRARRQSTAPLGEADEIASDAPSQLDIIESAEDASRLARCLEELDERARSMIRTAFFDGATYPELAQREGVPLATMKSWIRRGLIRLRGCLEQ
jgi:RNA polymerase sigma-70 factor (ECF subfamily)